MVDAERSGVQESDDAAECLAEARARALAMSGSKRKRSSLTRRVTRPRGAGGLSGPGPDARDPQLVGSALASLISSRGWDRHVTVGSIAGRWPRLVGTDIAAHAHPEVFADGVLTVRAESTTWATQLKWLAPQMLQRLTEELGEGVVTRVDITGPVAPSWNHGPLRVRGRGPRDTYG